MDGRLGFTGTCPIASSSSDTFGNLAQYLVSDGVPVVYLFDNCVEDPGQLIETLGNDLGDFLNSIKYDTGAQVPQIDLVGLQHGRLDRQGVPCAGCSRTEALTPPATTLVRQAGLDCHAELRLVCGRQLCDRVRGRNRKTLEMEPGSSFFWNLATWNQRGDDLRGVDAIAVIGNAGVYTPSCRPRRR